MRQILRIGRQRTLQEASDRLKGEHALHILQIRPGWTRALHHELRRRGCRAEPGGQTLTNTTLRERFKLHEKQRNQVTNLIGDAVDAGRIKRKDLGAGKKFAEYVPYWA